MNFRKLRRRTRHFTTVAILKFIILLGKALPYKPRIKWSAWVLAKLSSIPKNAREAIRAHCELIYPSWSEQKRKEFIQKNIHHFAHNLAELYNIEEFGTRIDRFHVKGKGLKIIEEQKKKGAGAICVSGHFGQWEAIRAYMAANDMPMAGLYKKHTNPFYERMFNKALNHSGPMYHTGVRGMSGLVKKLKRGGFISLLHDQAVNDAPQLEFMGQKVHTSLASAELALKYDVPLIPIYAIRQDNGYDYEIVFEAPIPMTDALTMTKAMNLSLEERVRAHPQQWLWIYDRWKHFDGV